ncbi:secretion-regulating guanine nucleotide exchange factor isoform X2 [Orussus abietinus]|uniref:secretion-regulating guanine nucleotide exchange factor isoform X2 n=1 Tax=Orussus abietinus TaxID=222816 RepID=UPI000625D5C6|nr:secretion-regulating guanine nucleotide exchange factor isoform X2 [Orussus abietinus]
MEGANSHGQLGQNIEDEQLVLPTEVDLSQAELRAENIVKIVGGAGLTLILDKLGDVYSCGWNTKGQTGIPVAGSILKFKEIEYLRNEYIIDVACGWDSSMALTRDGYAFVWGSNRFGQLGNDLCEKQDTVKPIKITSNKKIVRCSMGLRHSAYVTEDGLIFVTGSNSKGQLGVISPKGKQISMLTTFTRVPGLTDVVDVACGQHHTVVATREGIYSWGSNKYGQLGHDSVENTIPFPKRIQNIQPEYTKVYAGWTHTVTLNRNGDVLNWGRNIYGQLGGQRSDQDHWKPKSIQNLPKIKELGIGSEHNIALTEDRSIICWGWNEHGNCGNGSTENILIPENVSTLRDFNGVVIGAGAGHSFAVIQKCPPR